MTDRKAALVDLDGTVYRGGRLISGADDGIGRLRAAGLDTVFLSNNAAKRPAQYRAKLSDLGIEVAEREVLNSAAVAAEYLSTAHPEANAYVIGEAPLVAELEAAGLTVTADPAATDVVLASADRTFGYEQLRDVLDADATGARPPLYATNPDRTLPVEDGEIPDCAPIIGAVRELLDRDFDGILGKPSEVIVDVALARLGVDASECIVIGDRLDTDVRMGERAGMETALVLSGVTDRNELADASVDPDHVLDSLADVADVLR